MVTVRMAMVMMKMVKMMMLMIRMQSTFSHLALISCHLLSKLLFILEASTSNFEAQSLQYNDDHEDAQQEVEGKDDKKDNDDADGE